VQLGMTNARVFWFTVMNFVTYSAWTMLNKKLFTLPPHQDPLVSWSPSPLLCTAMQMFVAAFAAWICVVQLGCQRSPDVNLLDRVVWRRRIVPLGLSRAVDIGCGNYALSLVTVALQQVVKATLPIFVTILSVTVLRKRVSWGMAVNLVPVVLGTIVASVPPSVEGPTVASPQGPPPLSVLGVGLALTSCFGRASKAVLNALLLSGAGSVPNAKMQPLEIVLLEAPTTGLIILVPALLLEGPLVLWHGTSQLVQQPLFSLGLNTLCGLLMFLTQIAYVTLIAETSALSCQVLMSLKMLFLVFLSVWWMHTPFSALNGIGVLIAGCGCVLYAKAAQGQQAEDVQGKKHDGDIPPV
jgi:drug/metabolite transporter (DMT)-like permease